VLIRKIFGAILLLAIVLPQVVSAEKTDWYDRNFYFRNLRTLIVLDMTVTPGIDPGGSIALRQMLSYQLGMNLNAMPYEQARHIIIQNAYRIADGWILGNVDNLANTYYIEPARTVWEQKSETRTYYDAWGNLREESYYVQVPVTYPPRRVDITSIQVTMQVYESRGGAMVFARKDVRDREDFQAQKGMFGRISNSFFEDVAKRMR